MISKHNRIYQILRSYFFSLKRFYQTYILSLITGSYSQFKEDLIIDRLLNFKKKGFYIDIGANHPSIFSNTKRFYERGWHGINIEPNPLAHKKLLVRKRDLNLNIGIGENNLEQNFYCFNEDTVNTFSLKSKNLLISQGFNLIDTLRIKTFSLKEVIEKYATNLQIDFISIDVEGYEMQVLKSNDWDLCKPELIILESNHKSKNMDAINEHMNYLKDKGYVLKYFNGLNSFFIKK